MRYTVFHFTGNRFSSFDRGAYLDHWPGPDYRKVATVEASSLSAVFDITQHHEEPWTGRSDISLTPADALKVIDRWGENSSVVLGIRSTSVGDVIVDDSGHAHGVAPFGFEPLGKVTDAVRAQVDLTRVKVRNGELSGPMGFARVTALQDWRADSGVL